MKRLFQLFALTLFSCVSHAQTPWVLQEYMHRIGTQANQYLGKYVSGIGDYNGDGKPDVAVGYSDPVALLGKTGIWYVTANTDSSPNKIYFGQNMKRGDVNGDGYMDLIIVRSPRDPDPNGVDSVQIYFGNATGVDSIPGCVLLGENRYDEFGRAIAIGDINGDGIKDLVISAPSFNLYHGKVYVYYGRIPFPSIADLTFQGDTIGALLGNFASIGDISADGSSDLVLTGAQGTGQPEEQYRYLNVYFGGAAFDTTRDFQITGLRGRTAVGGLEVMDANGDGTKDIVWGFQDSTGARTVRMYYGRSQLSTTPGFILPQPSFAPNFGLTIANAGDMDGDGFQDIAVGDWTAFGDNGVVLIYRAGLVLDTAWDAGKSISGFGNFGRSIDGLGDVNGDGLSDIIVGAMQYGFTGAGYFGIYLGDHRITSVDESVRGPALPEIAVLEQSYPNPFNSTTTIRYRLLTKSNIALHVFDLLGRNIATLFDGEKDPGSYAEIWEASDVPSGVYFYRLTAASRDGRFYSSTKKAVLIK